MTTREKAFETAWDSLPRGSTLIARDSLRGAIAAYLSALLPEDVAGLVERLREGSGYDADGFRALRDDADQAASLIQSQAARIASLEAKLGVAE